MTKIFIYGPPGSGKTTVGKALSQNLNIKFLDLDFEIEAVAGKTITQFIEDHGEQSFRNLETEILSKLCRMSDGVASIISLGGGTLLRAENRALCEKNGSIICLDIDYSTLLARISIEDDKRPLLKGNLEKKLFELLEQRKGHYSSFDIRIATIKNSIILNPKEIAWKIQQVLGKFHISGMGNGYDVNIEPGAINKLGSILIEHGIKGPIVIVTDENVAEYYEKKATESLFTSGFKVKTIAIAPGEENKNIATVGNLWHGFLSAGLDRKSTVIALGGGVVGDLAGFAASTYMRGCSWVGVPTTLLSMVDSSLGGKTGFDLPEGKNLIGSFHPPLFVLADPDALATLPDRELRSGLAEVVKHGIIADQELFEMCSSNLDAIREIFPLIISRAMGVKARIIVQDPFEKGIRASLNLGHTVGHALEVASNFTLLHGEAVAIGLVAEARLAEKIGVAEIGLGLSNRIEKTLCAVGLPTKIPPDLDKELIIASMKVDKKKENNIVKFALPVDIGNVKIGVEIRDLEMVL